MTPGRSRRIAHAARAIATDEVTMIVAPSLVGSVCPNPDVTGLCGRTLDQDDGSIRGGSMNEEVHEARPGGEPSEQNEGRYTDVDGKPVSRRSLRGRYTRTEGAGPDLDTKGAYTDADHPDKTAAPSHSVHDRPGKYTRRDQ
jgi:hypothetical protein